MNRNLIRALALTMVFICIEVFTVPVRVYGETVSSNSVSSNSVSSNSVSKNSLSLRTPALYAALDSTFPTTKAELDTALKNGQYGDNTFYVTKKDDLLALELLSQDFSFMTEKEDGSKVQWKIAFQQMVNGTNATSTEWSLPTGFTGFGTKDKPFQGKIYSYLDGMSYKLTSPLIAYAAPEAAMEKMAITANINETSAAASSAMIARNLVRSSADGGATMSFSNVSLYGYVTNETGNAAVLYGEVINQTGSAMELSSTAAGITMNGLTVTGKYAGSIAGTVTGSVELTASDLFTTAQVTVQGSGSAPVNGAESVYDANGASGMIAGFLRADTEGRKPELILDATAPGSYDVQITGSGMNGGLVGAVENGTIRTTGDAALVLSGSVTGSTAGALAGYVGNSDITVKNISVTAAVNVSSGDLYAGGLLGHFYQTAASADDTVFEKLKLSGTVASSGAAGGVIGFIEANQVRMGNPAAAADLTVSGSVSGRRAAGGVAGQAAGRYIEFSNCEVSAVCQGSSVGKILGTARENAVIKIQNVVVNGSMAPASGAACGGLAGTLEQGVLCALDKTIDVGLVTVTGAGTKTGHLIGAQTEALVYKETSCNYTRPTGKAWVDDIGTYGGVYLNGTWGEQSSLISYENAKVNGTVGSNSPYTIDSEADLLRLAIVLNTEGRFAEDCFGGQEKAALLAAEYQITKSLDLCNSGIYSLNRNDETGKGQQFTGSFGGTGKVTLTFQNMAEQTDRLETYQSYLSLFPSVKAAAFKNIVLQRRVAFAKTAAAGLACYAEDAVSVEGVESEVELTGSTDGQQYYYGGLFARYTTANGAVLTIQNTTLSGGITLAGGGQHYAGGLAAVYEQSGNDVSTIAIDGLVIKNAITSNSSLVSSMLTQINGTSTNYTTDKTILSLKDITVQNGTELTISGSNVTGGFLGREWKNVAVDAAKNYSILNLTIGEGGTAAEGPQYSSNGYFGGLVHTITGRIQLKNTRIQNGTFHAANSGSESNGLLFYNGLDALIEIEDYEIAGYAMNPSGDVTQAAGSKVAITGATKGFDEIVGDNIGSSGSERNQNSCRNGGVVNIINPAFSDMTSTAYTSYRNRLLSIDVPASTFTRYHYNLFGDSLAGESAFLAGKQINSTNPVITSGEEMMVWHLAHYMNDSIRRYLEPYYTGGVQNRNLNTVFSGTIDLNGKSYYPTFVTGGTYTGAANAEIKFYGQEIVTGEATATGGRKSPQLSYRQHYMMHAGLFDSAWGNVTVQGGESFLTLSGSISNIGGNSGGLFVRSISGVKQIYHVRLNGLYLVDYTNASAVGLLIGIVNDGTTLDLSYIETAGYETLIGSNKKAAAALIGRAGSVDGSNMSSTKNLNIDFTNMRISDRTTGIFRYASYIDQYFYTDDASINKGHGRYLFTKNAFDGTALPVENSAGTEFAPFTAGSAYGNNTYDKSYVTIGAELAGGVEYWDVNTTDPKGPVDGTAYPLPDTNKNDTASTYSFVWSAANITANYIPYIGNAHAASKDIQVNPKNANIIEGCGTYEDPYVITKAGQLLALSIYVNLADGADDRYLDKWKMNRIGSNEVFCEGTHTEEEYQYTGAGNGNTAFPTKDELRCAYYEIAQNIDLSALSSATDKQISQDFYGLGTEQHPFSGVILGKEGTVYTITLPLKKTNNTVSDFGLIAYGKGAVVKDIHITSNRTQTDTTLSDIVKVTGTTGGVIAVVLGGDNIIDNVTVTNRAALASTSVNAGGYVGVVREGSVILRNLTDPLNDGADKSYSLHDSRGTALSAVNIDKYPYASGLIGKVENGVVLCEDADAAGEVTERSATSVTGMYAHAYLPISRTFDLVNTKALESETIAVTGDAEGKNFSAVIANAKQLQLLSMTINSDAFNIYYGAGGYDRLSRCRKAAYSKVGTVTKAESETEAGADYRSARDLDNGIYYLPYLYRYYTFDGGVYKTLQEFTLTNAYGGGTGYISKLNGASNVNAATYAASANDSKVTAVMSYTLAENVTYDTSVYRQAFRGIGDIYRMMSIKSNPNTADYPAANAFYSDFRANLDGNNATVVLAMDRAFDNAIEMGGLFNDLLDRTNTNPYTIKNLVLTGKVQLSENTRKESTYEYTSDRVGAVAGLVARAWSFENIKVQDMTIQANGMSGGILGMIGPRKSDNQNETYQFKSCTVTGKTAVLSRRTSAGGLIGGVTMIEDQSSSFYNLGVTFTDCQIGGTDASVNAVTIEALRAGMTAAGDDNSTENQARMGVGRAGGFIGYCGRRNGVSAVSSAKITVGTNAKTSTGIKNVKLSGAYSAGGLIGEQSSLSGSSQLTVTNALIEDSVITGTKHNADTTNCVYGVGGLIGKFDDANAAVAVSASKLVRTKILSTYADTTYYGLSIGGIAGFLRAKTGSLTNIEIGEEAGTLYEMLLAQRSDAGGLIGKAAGGNGITVKAVQLNNTLIAADNRSAEDRADDICSGTPVDYVTRAGGYVGSLACNLTVEKPDGAYNTVKGCQIISISNSAGGIVGGKETAGKLTMKGLLIENNEIGQNAKLETTREIGNGGLIGKLSGNAYLEDSQVINNRIYGSNVGGICGYSNKNSGNLEIGNISGTVEIKENAMLGGNVGGVLGLSAGKTLNVLGTVIEKNRMLACHSAASEAVAAAGGVIGKQESTDTVTGFYLDGMTLKENKILARSAKSTLNTAAGGLIGYTSLDGKSHYVYEPVLMDNQIGVYAANTYDGKLLSEKAKRADILACLSSNADENGIASTGVKAYLLNWGLVSVLTGAPTETDTLPANLTESKLAGYATGIGNFAGRQDATGHLYILAPAVSYTDTYAGICPVIDVGSTTKEQSSPQTLLSAPYEYRKNIHIIYYNADTTSGNTAAARWTDKNMLFSQINLENIFTEYKEALSDGTNEQWKKTLAAYKLGIETDLSDGTNPLTYTDIYEKAYRNADGTYVSPLYNSATRSEATKLPLLVMDTQYGAIDTQLSAVLSALTGVGGGHSAGDGYGQDVKNTYNSAMTNILNVTVQGKQLRGGTITNAATPSSIAAAKTNGKWELTYQGFDKEETDAAAGTFSLITVTYSWKHTPAGKSSQETYSRSIQLPVFVLERLTIDTHTKIAEGFVYSADKAKKDGLDSNVVMASDSSYTMYSEFIYGSARSKYEQSIDKVFSMHYVENGEDRSYNFLNGTKLTLLDVNDQNKAYYYTVSGSTTNAIKYSDFKDADGNPYVNKKLNAATGYEVHTGEDKFVTVADGITYTYEDVAVERFLMLVDISGADGGGSETSASTFEISPQIGEELKRNTTLTEHTTLGVIKLPGLTISLADKGTNTEIDGSIARDDTLVIDADIFVSASQPYWNAVIANRNNTIDSANHNKYLELQIYLTDGINQVALPDNTNVSISGKRTNPALLTGESSTDITIPNTNLGAYVSSSQIYFYKDYKDRGAGTIQFPLDSLTAMMQKEAQAGYIYGTVNWQQQIQVSFASADLNDYTAAGYDVNLELLRISDPDYPSGGTTIDTYKKTCSARQQEDLSCALLADDLMELGINTYQNETPLPHTIHGTFVLDFEQLLGKGNVNLTGVASKYYTVTYRLYKKKAKAGGFEYVPYTGTNITLGLEDAATPLQSGNGTEAGAAFPYQYATWQFGESELKDGSAGEPGIIIRKLNLTVGDAVNDTEDLTNYKLVASVKVSDTAPIAAEMDGTVNAGMNDFFIFTIAKLKTDLDY